MTPDYYDNSYKGLKLDPYRLQLVLGITHPIQAHIHKKVCRMHKENHKSLENTLLEIKGACDRWLEMLEEDRDERQD